LGEIAKIYQLGGEKLKRGELKTRGDSGEFGMFTEKSQKGSKDNNLRSEKEARSDQSRS